MTNTVYTVEALSTGGGRDGHVRTTDGAIDLDMRAPKELGGSGEGRNPEQLFAAGYATCFHSALLGVARAAKMKIDGSSVGARVSLNADEAGGVFLEVHLEVVIPDLPQAAARDLAEKAHQMCPYSKATRGNITVTVDVTED